MKKLFLIMVISLSCFSGQAFSQTPQQIYAALPQINDWIISPDIEIFNSDNLYERINGAAPLFFENNFREMTSITYTSGDDYITIQVYRHATPEDAFGMYSSERSSDMEHFDGIGGEAQGDVYGLFFFTESLYVKMMTNNESEGISAAMKKVAAGFAGKISSNNTYPKIINSFLKEGLIPYSQAYITRNYIGHEFLKSVYTVDYELSIKKFQAFVIDAESSENAKQILNDYFKFTKQDEPVVEGNLLIKDRYNGSIPVVWKGRYLIGAFDEKGGDFPNEIFYFLNWFDL